MAEPKISPVDAAKQEAFSVAMDHFVPVERMMTKDRNRASNVHTGSRKMAPVVRGWRSSLDGKFGNAKLERKAQIKEANG